MREFSLVSLVVGASLELCGAGFSSWGPGLCGAGSVAGAAASGARAPWLGPQPLRRGLGGWGSRAHLLCGMWDLPGPGIDFVSPAMAGGFFPTELPGSPLNPVLERRK